MSHLIEYRTQTVDLFRLGESDRLGVDRVMGVDELLCDFLDLLDLNHQMSANVQAGAILGSAQHTCFVVNACLAVKSKRMRSGATSDPFWSTLPSTFSKLWFRIWVPVWFFMISQRRGYKHSL